MQRKLIMTLVVIMVLALAGCKPATPEPVVLEIQGISESRSLTMADLKDLVATEGQAGTMSSTGKITIPELFTGVSLKDLVALVGDFTPDLALEIEASDGYSMTFSYDQVMNGDFIAYDPGSGAEITPQGPLTAILAYAHAGQPLDAQTEGTLRLMVVSPQNDQVVDGHWAIKWVTKITVKPTSQDWTLHLEGAIVEDVDRGSFESCSAPSCHGASWEDLKAQTWAGVPLMNLVGRVDDEISHNGPAFNTELAQTGYTVEIVSADGTTVTLNSADLIGNKNIMLAYSVNDNPLTEDNFPLRLVGADVPEDQMIGKITSIIVHIDDAQ